LIKLSGEFLQGEGTGGVCWDTLGLLSRQIKGLAPRQIVLVLGGGNFFRGVQRYTSQGETLCSLATADTMGMLATLLNALAFSEALHKEGVPNRLFSAQPMASIAEAYHPRQALRALQDGEVVLCAGGLGHGAMTTDTAAVVRACELECHMLLKGTSVQGVYSHDPKLHEEAVFYPTLSLQDALDRRLRIMDLTALTLALEHKKPILIFSLRPPNALVHLVQGTHPYSLLTP
jgi:uridylate kinase